MGWAVRALLLPEACSACLASRVRLVWLEWLVDSQEVSCEPRSVQQLCSTPRGRVAERSRWPCACLKQLRVLPAVAAWLQRSRTCVQKVAFVRGKAGEVQADLSSDTDGGRRSRARRGRHGSNAAEDPSGNGAVPRRGTAEGSQDQGLAGRMTLMNPYRSGLREIGSIGGRWVRVRCSWETGSG